MTMQQRQEWGDRKTWVVLVQIFWLRGVAIAGLAIAPVILLSPVSRAQQALPPPPPFPDGNSLPSLAPLNGSPQTAPSMPGAPAIGYPSESIYQAPSQVPTYQSPMLTPIPAQSIYQVVVNGSSPLLLQQVQLIEPSASLQDYQGRQIIQVGTYTSEMEARQRVSALAQQGIGAQVISANFNPGYPPQASVGMNSPAPIQDLSRMPHYEVVVPTSPDRYGIVTNKMITMGVRPEAIQAKKAPLGPHVSVGPFLQQSEAESVNRYLRSGGMDARVYYAR